VRTCPRCGVRVEVYNTTCSCGFSWAPQTSSEADQYVQIPGEYRPGAVREPSRRVPVWPWVLGLLLIAVVGWHIYCAVRLETSSREYIRSRLGEGPADATIEVHVQPVTNLVAIELRVVDKDAATMKPSDQLLLDAALSYIRSEIEPYLERELSLIARRQVDPYAIAIPYRIDFSLKISPKR
jgi:hypothetical protein